MKSEKDKPLFSVVTVVFNGESFLEKTIRSLLAQTYKNWEYIVIDGGSVDGTVEIIRQYNEDINYWVSEKDDGIYDAMNKAMSIASGEYINFMNAGDVFSGDTVLEEVASGIDKQQLIPDIIIGATTIYSEKGKKIKFLNPLHFSKMFFNMFNTRVVCHQSMFVRTAKAVPYSKKYTIKGDLNWYYDLIKTVDSKTICYVPISICNYILGGVSNTNLTKSYKEQIEVMYRQNNFITFLVSTPFLLIPLIFKIKQKLMIFLPEKAGISQHSEG